jgi:hypothetical protein
MSAPKSTFARLALWIVIIGGTIGLVMSGYFLPAIALLVIGAGFAIALGLQRRRPPEPGE